VHEVMLRWFGEEVGNAGSRTHEYGVRAKKAVEAAREQVASVVGASPEEVTFTSGATESNNLAILGIAASGRREQQPHVISTAIEHKAVLEPLQFLQSKGFDVTLIKPEKSGAVSAEAVDGALRSSTVLVSIMHVNNETGVRQPIGEIAAALGRHNAYFHVDAAQGFGKELDDLRSRRIDLISASSHKVYGPMGVGALIGRRRGFSKPPLEPLAYGGGQERGLRPGTLPVPLVVGFGLAAELACKNANKRHVRCMEIRADALRSLQPLGIRIHGDLTRTLSHVMNFSLSGVDSEALMVGLKDLAAISNGSACTSQSYQPSHVLTAMGLPDEAVAGAVRLSWSHLTPQVDWAGIADRIRSLL
jgi:cysteine desulfurase